MHFDDAKTWALADGRGNVDIETVALHEIVHAPGLRHSGHHQRRHVRLLRRRAANGAEVDIKGMRSRYPKVVQIGAGAVTVPLWALEFTGGCDVVNVDLGRTVRSSRGGMSP